MTNDFARALVLLSLTGCGAPATEPSADAADDGGSSDGAEGSPSPSSSPDDDDDGDTAMDDGVDDDADTTAADDGETDGSDSGDDGDDAGAFDDSPLAIAAAALAPDEAGPFTMGGVPTITEPGGGSILEYVSRALWDPTHGKIRFVGVSHNNGWAQYADYSLSDDAWAQELVPDGRTDPRHAYSGTACDPTTGTTFYHEGNGGDVLWTRANDGEWVERTNPQPGWANVEWHPTLGVLVIGQVWGIRTFDPATEAFDVLHDDPSGTTMSDSAGASAYSGKDDSVYVGNVGDDNGAIWRIDATGAATPIASPPVPVRIHDAWNNSAMLIGAADPDHRLLAIRQNAEIYEYDEEVDAWSDALPSDPGLVEFIQGASLNQWIAVSLPELGVLVFMRQTGEEMDTTVWLWKH